MKNADKKSEDEREKNNKRIDLDEILLTEIFVVRESEIFVFRKTEVTLIFRYLEYGCKA